MSAREKVHFVGVAGTGMSALAQLRALEGAEVTGSDRDPASAARLKAAGVSVFPQDGSGVDAATGRVVISTAIEKDNADLAKAAALGVKVVHRADELGAVASSRKTVAVAGTSGKSTVTAMVFHILSAAGKDPSLVTGAALPSLKGKGLIGNAWLGKSDLLVIEADESDGTIDRYRPWLGLLLNVTKDHKPVPELLELFRGFKSRSSQFVVNADAGLQEFESGALTFGFKRGALRAEGLELTAADSRFFLDGTRFNIPLLGAYNAENALAAVAACRALGVSLDACAAALASFSGVARRFELVGEGGGVTVYDDFAHNPEKLAAVLGAARLRSSRVYAVFQLHGFAPARFLRKEFVAALTASLRPDDVLYLPPIFYAGGTAAKDISARDYADDLKKNGKNAVHVERRSELPALVAASAKAGDLVLVMGARDPSLSALAVEILEALKRR